MSRKKLMKKLEEDLEVTPYLFVYGTLKLGEYNYFSYLSSSEYIGPRVTSDRYLMVDVGFPYVYPEYLFVSMSDEYLRPVLGDLFELDDPEVLRNLDLLEGEGHHYHRKTVLTTDGELAWMYYNKSATRKFWKCNITENGEWEWKPKY